MIARILAPAALVLLIAGGAAAQPTSGSDCAALTVRYDEYMKTAHGVAQSATESLLKAGKPSKQLGQLGLDIGALKSADEAIRKGAVAAMAPPVQNAVLIYLLFANTTMQEMAWKGCKAP